MYGIGGERILTETSLPHLTGYRGSRPVRIGNGAWNQSQLDTYGWLLASSWFATTHPVDGVGSEQTHETQFVHDVAARWCIGGVDLHDLGAQAVDQGQ